MRDTIIAITCPFCPKCQEAVFGTEEEEECEPPDDCDYEVGFDPYSGCFTDDC